MENYVVHIDIPVDDIEKAENFYSKLFDWEFTKVSDEYMTFTSAKTPSGAFYLVTDLPEPGICPYVWTKDIDDVLDKVIDQGGRIVQNKTTIPSGFQAIFIDPFGNRIGVYSPPSEETKEEKSKDDKEKKSEKEDAKDKKSKKK
ncbi:MAG: VOC family protein [Candidatus Lokiarchaeota archaeon]|nr:VOC family protein [Candidatus Lokiarchaeota archaeon]